MMGAATLQPPKSGRSRFSKALPAPPSLPTFEFESQFDLAPLVPEKALPHPQPTASLPPVPPPKRGDQDRETTMAAIAKPLNSPLPSLPPKSAGPPLRSIPRRPVAAPVHPTPALAPASSPAVASPNPLPSPGGSISSLLSAYSNHTDDEPRSASANSPQGILNPKSAYSVVSPNLGVQNQSGAQFGAPTRDLPSLPSGQNAQRQEPSSRMLEGDRKELPPPPPLKDPQRSVPRPRTPPSLQTQTAQPSTSTTAGSPLVNGSPQQGELWRRRSLKADKSLAVPDLKLVSSHGSTAASVQDASQSGPSSLFSQPFPLPPRSNPGTLEPATTQRAPPRSANGGLPGRNIRPTSSEEPAQGEASMGQQVSRIKEKLEHGRRRGSGEEAKQAYPATATLSPTTTAAVSPVSAARLPTPEYTTNDVKSPLPDTLVSPLSPASSPELAAETKPITRKAIRAPEAQLHHAKSSQSLAPGPINTGLGVRSPMGLPTSPRPDVSQGPNQTQLPSSPAADKTQAPTQTQYLPVSPTPGRTQGANQPAYLAYSSAPDRNQAPNQKQYMPYSPPADRDNGPTAAQFPKPPSTGDEDQRPLPAGPNHEAPPTTSSQPTAQQNAWPQNPTRDPIPRTISETGSIETVKPQQRPPPVLVHPTPNPSFTFTPEDQEQQPLPRRSSPPTDKVGDDGADYTTHPGAALFPRGWYAPLPTDAIPDAKPLTERHFACLTQHRYMTANRQRTNPLACRTCGHKDRNAECYICSACYLNVCSGCVAVVRRCRGDLGAVLKEVERGRSRRSEPVDDGMLVHQG